MQGMLKRRQATIPQSFHVALTLDGAPAAEFDLADDKALKRFTRWFGRAQDDMLDALEDGVSFGGPVPVALGFKTSAITPATGAGESPRLDPVAEGTVIWHVDTDATKAAVEGGLAQLFDRLAQQHAPKARHGRLDPSNRR